MRFRAVSQCMSYSKSVVNRGVENLSASARAQEDVAARGHEITKEMEGTVAPRSEPGKVWPKNQQSAPKEVYEDSSNTPRSQKYGKDLSAYKDHKQEQIPVANSTKKGFEGEPREQTIPEKVQNETEKVYTGLANAWEKTKSNMKNVVENFSIKKKE